MYSAVHRSSLSGAGLILSVVSMGGAAVIVFQNSAAGVIQLGVGMLSAGIFILTGLLTWVLGKYFVKVTASFSKWLAGTVTRIRRKNV